MNIYKLNYIDKKTAIADLKSKGLLLEEGFGLGVHAIVEIGEIVLNEAESIFADGYHYDIMCEQDIDFGINEVFPVKSAHSFLGHEPNTNDPVEEEVIIE